MIFDFLVYIAPAVFVFLVIILIYWLLKKVRGNRVSARRRGRGNLKKRPPKRIESQLLRMVGGDREILQRLFAGAKARYPGKPESWYWERVMSDLERDRG